ncbi:unnamed protein product [Mytilus coruscus]|uniref:Uncharacterized protein n=1 Tax=Mytilus coruscus TaxID=42192 RepID=A0A6J8C297_MYTCO|nr:unnamed protein product [Mytilus coruscus]
MRIPNLRSVTSSLTNSELVTTSNLEMFTDSARGIELYTHIGSKERILELENNSQKKSKIDAEHYTPFLKQAKIENKVASLVRDKLYIDGALYKPNDQRRKFREAASLTTVSGGVPLPILQIDRRLQTDKFNQLQVTAFFNGEVSEIMPFTRIFKGSTCGAECPYMEGKQTIVI